jgi:hypothetical protein
MKRPKSRDKRFKTHHWTQNQKLQAVSTWLMLGNMAETAIVTSIPIQTLKTWKTSDWWKEACLQLQQEDLQQTTAKLRKIVDKALKAVEDRLDLGDAMYDQRTGAIVRIPVKAHVALKISTELLTKQERLMDNPIKQEVEKTIDDRLLKLSEEFSKFAALKSKTIDVEVVEVHDKA